MQETLTIKKVSDDNTINTVLVDGIECKNYDETTKTYTAYIDAKNDEVTLSVMANSIYATVVVNKISNIGNVITDIDTTNEITKVEMMVKSETGKTEKYYINIIKKSADASAEIIKVNDIVISDPYEVDIKRLDNKVKIYVKATNEKASVKIADEDEELSESTAILEISKGVDDVLSLIHI